MRTVRDGVIVYVEEPEPSDSRLHNASADGNLEAVKSLLTTSIDIELVTYSRSGFGGRLTALMHAAQNGHLPVVRELLTAGANVNAQTPVRQARCSHDVHEYGETALMLASSRGHQEIVGILLAAGAHVNAYTNCGNSALIKAVERGEATIVQMLLAAQADVNATRVDGATALMIASEKEDAEIVAVLLQHGADVNAVTPAPEDFFAPRHFLPISPVPTSALAIACNRGNPSVLNLLINAQANLFERGYVGCTPLMLAAPRGNIEAVELLLASHVEIDATDDRGETAVMLATERGQIDVVKALIDAGADLWITRPTDGSSAISLALKYGRHEILQLLIDSMLGRASDEDDQALNVTRAWLKTLSHGGIPADAPCRSKISETLEIRLPSQAIQLEEFGGYEALKWAAANGCFAEMMSTFGEPAINLSVLLMIAVFFGHTDFAEFLLANQAEVNFKDRNGITPLMLASYRGHIKLVQTLLTQGADLSARSHEGGSTAILIAADRGHPEVVATLLTAGANANDNLFDSRTALHFAVKAGHAEIVSMLEHAGAKDHFILWR